MLLPSPAAIQPKNTNLPEPLETPCREVPTPDEMNRLTSAILREAEDNGMQPEERHRLIETIALFNRQWGQCFGRFGRNPAGELAYRDLILDMEERIVPTAQPWIKAGPGSQALAELTAVLGPKGPDSDRPLAPDALAKQRRKAALSRIAECCPPVFERPLFIVSPPRSGSTLLFEILAGFPELWTVGEESHGLIEGIPELHPAAHGYASNRLTAADAKPGVAAALRERFARQLQDRAGRAYAELSAEQRPTRVRFLEKTPKNALRIPFLRAAFPNARFLVLYRRPEETLASMLEGWRGRRFVAYQPLPGWPHRAWKFLLVPGWESLAYRPLVDIAAHQWSMAYETVLADLREMPPATWQLVRYADLVNDPAGTLRQIAHFAELVFDTQVEQTLAGGLPWSSMTFSAPDPDKWRKHAAAINTVLPGLLALAARIERLGASGNSEYPTGKKD